MDILLSLGEREQYGFELISGIAMRAAIDVSEGTIYPLLLRLAKDGLISSRLAEGDGGAPRKYYILTIQGRQLLQGMIPSWSKLAPPSIVSFHESPHDPCFHRSCARLRWMRTLPRWVACLHALVLRQPSCEVSLSDDVSAHQGGQHRENDVAED